MTCKKPPQYLRFGINPWRQIVLRTFILSLKETTPVTSKQNSTLFIKFIGDDNDYLPWWKPIFKIRHCMSNSRSFVAFFRVGLVLLDGCGSFQYISKFHHCFATRNFKIHA